MPKNQSKEQH